MQTNLFDENSNILDGLNDKQKEAVTHKSGPLLIIAGAGTGKTSVITRRIAWLIEQKLAKPSEICALTFTEKAAAEMEERVDNLVPYGFTDMWIGTFHAFGDRLLRDFAIDLGLPANFKVLTSTEQAIFMKQNIYAFDLDYYRPIASPLSHIEALLNHFSRLKDELITPEEYLHFSEPELKKCDGNSLEEPDKTLELARGYQRYQELMIQSGNLDFGDLIYLSCKLLQSNKKVLETIHKKYKYILVDEFQDTNFAQNELVKLLAAGLNNITVVGDDDQSIYRFRGASISNIMQFKEIYPDMRQIVLNQNYRSTQEILDSSYRLIQNNNPDRLEIKNNINKQLIATKHGIFPELLYFNNLSAEADGVTQKIIELKNKHSWRYNDFAILVRANNSAEPFIQALNVNGIPHIFSGISGLYSQPEIKMLIAFLKSLTYNDDSLALYQLATSELYEINHDILTELFTEAKRSNRSLFTIVANSNDESLSHLIDDISKYRERKNESCGELLYDYLKEKGYLKKLSAKPTPENERTVNNIAKFFNRISDFNHHSDDRGVLAFLVNLELILEFGDDVTVSDIDPDIDAVNILTAHASKGLEYKTVFIISCVADRFPSRRRKDPLPIPDQLIKEKLPEGDYHIEEERRLFYVSATRAKEYLFVTAAEDYGGKRTKKISPFVMELLDKPNLSKIKTKPSALETIERFKKNEAANLPLPEKFNSEILRLSRQQIDDYYSCPKKFYYVHILGLPLQGNQYLMYGTAIHAALDHYFRRKINDENVGLEQLISDYKQAFKNVGFISREQEDLRYKQGVDTLTRFFTFDQSSPTIPVKVEDPFEFFENNIKINGRYDLVCKAEKDSFEIRDFKTSDIKEQKDADRKIKSSTQMMIYALAWFEKYGTIPKTTLHFIESGLTGSRIFTEKELEKAKEMIFEVGVGIRKRDFSAKPDQRECQLCPYSDVCKESKK